MRTADRASESPTVPSSAGRRILVLFEAGRAGVAAVELARELASAEPATVTVVSVAPQAPRLRGCAPSAHDYDAAVRDAAARELDQAEELLWVLGSRVDRRLLVEHVDPPLEQYIASGAFDLVLLPRRRRLLRSAGHPAARRLSACARTEVRIVDPDDQMRRSRLRVDGVAGS